MHDVAHEGEKECLQARAERDAAIASAEKAKADADYCAKSWEREIEANNALRAKLKVIATDHYALSVALIQVSTMREALDSIRQYGNDTLSGRASGKTDRAWFRESVVEMTNRARAALTLKESTQ